MLGGTPMFAPPQFIQQPMQMQPAPPRFPTGQTLADGRVSQPAAASPPPRTVRGQAPDEVSDLHPVQLVLPSPEKLGIALPRSAEAAIDWAAAHRRLDQLGATCFHLERSTTGGCKVTCMLPAAQPGRSRQIEAQGRTQAEAVRAALDQAEAWARSK